MSLATLGGVAATRMRLQVPAWGLWWADVDLAEPAELEGVQTLTVGDVTATGCVYGGAYEGRASYRVVGGAGGWGTSVDARSYMNDLGVIAGDVVSDAANEVGETVEDAPQTVVGAHYARHDGLASDVLHALAPRAWYVGFDGVTRFGARTTTGYVATEPRTRVDRAGSIIEIATEQIAALVPGVTVDGSEPATDVEYILDETRLTVRVYADRAGLGDRMTSAIAQIIEALDPSRRYRGTFEFRVVNQTGNRLNLQPVRAANGFSDLRNVPVRPGMAGLKATVTPGCLALVTFVDVDPSRPAVVGFDDPDSVGWMPLALDLGGPGALGVVLTGTAVVTGTCQVGPASGTITGVATLVGSTRVSAAP